MRRTIYSVTTDINLIKFQFYERKKCVQVVKYYEVYIPN